LFILRYACAIFSKIGCSACAIFSKIGCSAFTIFPKIGCNNFFQILIRFSDLTLYIHTITHYESDSINNVEVNYDFL
jgi:hypothetical protein